MGTTPIAHVNTSQARAKRPEWLDSAEYPFESRFVDIRGDRMHYVDEGQGEVLLMVHGTPVWSFLYRHSIKDLSKRYRCIALDHLGFGLSDKPLDADYSPEAHAERLALFVGKLGLRNITLITQDFGGPISLDFASRSPDVIKRLVIANSWMWLHPRLEKGGKLFATRLGKWLYLRYGFSAKVMIPQSFGNTSLLTKHIHAHYLKPLSTPRERESTYALVRSFTTTHDWYNRIGERQKNLADKPVLMLWGMKDKFVPHHIMAPLWNEVWNNVEWQEIPEAGHFIEEEAPILVTRAIETFLLKHP